MCLLRFGFIRSETSRFSAPCGARPCRLCENERRLNRFLERSAVLSIGQIAGVGALDFGRVSRPRPISFASVFFWKYQPLDDVLAGGSERCKKIIDQGNAAKS